MLAVVLLSPDKHQSDQQSSQSDEGLALKHVAFPAITQMCVCVCVCVCVRMYVCMCMC